MSKNKSIKLAAADMADGNAKDADRGDNAGDGFLKRIPSHEEGLFLNDIQNESLNGLTNLAAMETPSAKESLSLSSHVNSSDDLPSRRPTGLEMFDVTDDMSSAVNYPHSSKIKGPLDDTTTVTFSTVSSAYSLVHAQAENSGRPSSFFREPNFLRCFLNCITIRNSHVALAVLCLCAMSQNITVGGANNAILSTIERAFYMTSMESALFLSIYDVANTISSPIIGYFGDRKFKPRIIGISMLGLSLASFIMILPQFVGDYGLNSTVISNSNSTSNEMLCNSSMYASGSSMLTTTPAPKVKFSGGNFKFMFYIANSINGISSVALYTITISYIENIFEKEQVNLRQGVYYTLGAIGVGIGMLLTGNFLNINGDIHKKFQQVHLPFSNTKLHPSSPSSATSRTMPNNSSNVNWVGAWWIIYAIAAVVNLILGLIVFRFSASLVKIRSIPSVATTTTLASKTSEKDEASSVPVVTQTSQTAQKSGFLFYLNDFLLNSKRILSNKVFFFIVCCTTCETLLIKGFSSYLTKYLEYEYRLFASTATMLAGAIGFISLVGGVLFGSFIIKHFKWHIKECAVFITVILSITSVLFLGLIVHCPQEEYIGSDFSISNYTVESLCHCDSNSFYPVCYKHKYLFQTPCHAGCLHHYQEDVYSDCLILNDLISNGTESNGTTLSPCDRPNKRCMPNLIVVSIVGLLVLFLSSIVILPILRIILETVSVENQSFALGIRSLVTKLFGNIPGPLIFAAIVDRSCVQWTKNSYNQSKTCRLYDNLKFSVGLGVLGSSFRVCSAIFAFITLLLIRRKGQSVSNPQNQPGNSQSESKNTHQIEENEIVLDPNQIHVKQGSSVALHNDFYDINLSDRDDRAADYKLNPQKSRLAGPLGHMNESFRTEEDLVEHF